MTNVEVCVWAIIAMKGQLMRYLFPCLLLPVVLLSSGCPPGDESTDYRIGIKKDLRERTQRECPRGWNAVPRCADGHISSGECPDQCEKD